ncbi:hypothetical protein BDV96DRAFT_317616 [Lophiotrema nucula]|uniref:Uncharacterized protein n=1 Tax=Lophiotrema nucula TaxID=690887 RepID=A0A6A5ZP54_9PLEO|nr:hypothetical protein BDV96DRAFT_317616 [Lophiotrema nucula]
MSSKDVEPFERYEKSDFHRPGEFGDCRSQDIRAQETSESSVSSIGTNDSDNNRELFTTLDAYESPSTKRADFVQSPPSTTTLALPSPPLPLDIAQDNEPQPHLRGTLPLSTNVVEALAVFRSLHTGLSIPAELKQRGVLRLPLSSREYDSLFEAIRQDASLRGWVEDKGRFEHCPRKARLLIYMSGPKHAKTTTQFLYGIEDSLAALRNDVRPVVAEFARRIQCTLDAEIPIRYQYGTERRPRPDNSWSYDAKRLPALVYETSFSQTYENLAEKLEMWILGTRGAIRTAVGIELSYPLAEVATLYVYTGKIVGGRVDVQKYSHLLRTSPNNLVHTGALNIPLEAFTPIEDSCNRLPMDAVIHIPASRFHAMLAEVDKEPIRRTLDDRGGLDCVWPSSSRGDGDDDASPEPYDPEAPRSITHNRNTRAKGKQGNGNDSGLEPSLDEGGNPTATSTTTSPPRRRSSRLANKNTGKPL